MYKILIVDDFLADRIKLREEINGLNNLDIEITGEAENGWKALEAIRNCTPDIIISDIEMPCCDGFELAKNIRINHPEIKIIFCSLYDEFEYAKRALYLGSYGYILKPINAKELRHCISNVINSISSELFLNEQAKEYIQDRKFIELCKPILADHFVDSLLLGRENGDRSALFEKADYLGISFIKGLYHLLYIEIDEFEKVTTGQSAEQRQILSLNIRERLRELLGSTDNCILTEIDESHFACILQFDDRQQELADKSMDMCCNKILMGFRKSDVSITISVSNAVRDILELKNMYESCVYLMKHKFILGGGRKIRGTDVPSVNVYPDIDFNSMIKDVRYLLNSGTKADIDEYLDRMFTELPSTFSEHYLKNVCFMLVTCAQIILSENNEMSVDMLQSDMMMYDKLNMFETIIEEKNWINGIFNEINERLARKFQTKNHKMVEDIINYVEKYFVKNINMDTLAADLYYSANYLNRIFKQETGETIFEYATKFRIEKAKELLSDCNVKLYEITDKLGYSNPAYFSGVFKKYTGMTPKEYRERNIV